MKRILSVCCLAILLVGFAESPMLACGQELSFPSAPSKKALSRLQQDYITLEPYFAEAYVLYPSVPRGILESISFNYSRFCLLSTDTVEEPQSVPRCYGVMGLTLNGKGVFRENLHLVSELSGWSVSDLVNDPRASILAYAAAFSVLQDYYSCYGSEMEAYLPVLISLSELPIGNKTIEEVCQTIAKEWHGDMSLYPLCSSLYSIYLFLSSSDMQSLGGEAYSVDFVRLFGPNLRLLGQKKLDVGAKDVESITDKDYPDAIWCPAASCNYAVGRSMTPSNIVIHYTSGTYSGTIAWFQNCQAQVSAHYVIRSIDGQVTQMVSEANRAWHVGNENGYTIGIEHEAYGNIYSYFTEAMYQSSAALVRNICSRRPIISPQRLFYTDTLDNGTVLNVGVHSVGGATACFQIRGHQHYPGQTHTDPGPYWNWNYYYKLVNPSSITDVQVGASGVFTDSGGSNGNYANNERRLTHIHVDNADSVALVFSSFDLEPDADYLFIYAGDNVFAPLLGRWNTQCPLRVVTAGEDMLVEFRSDCSGTRSGWIAQWQGVVRDTMPIDQMSPTTQICWNENDWVTGDFQVSFVDHDDVEIQHSFYQIMEYANGHWTANPDHGFLCDNFDTPLDATEWTSDATWYVVDGKLLQSSNVMPASCASSHFNGDAADVFLFDYYLSLESGDTCAFFFQANAAKASSPNFSGYQLVFNNKDHTLSWCKVVQGHVQELAKRTGIYYTAGQSYLYRIVWDRIRQKVVVFRHSSCLLEAADDGTSPSVYGEYVGFMTRHSSVKIDNLRAYCSRSATVAITIGDTPVDMIRTQASNGNARCKLKSIVMDGSNKFSSLEECSVKVDYTPPAAPMVYDGLYDDVDVVLAARTVTAHWTSVTDPQSGPCTYEYYLTRDTMSFIQDRIEWTNSGNQTAINVPYPYTTSGMIYVGVMAKNGAGLCSRVAFSDGAGYDYKFSAPYVRVSNDPPAVGLLPRALSTLDEVDYKLSVFDMVGRMVWQSDLVDELILPTQQWTKGVYLLRLTSQERILQTEKIIVR